MPADTDPLCNAATRDRIQKVHKVRDLLQANAALFLIIWAAAFLGSIIIYPTPWLLLIALLLLPFAKIVMLLLSVLPFIQFTLGGLFISIVAPQLGFVLLTSGHGTLELVGSAVLSIWITAIVYFMGKINAAMQRYDDEQKRNEQQTLRQRLGIQKFENQSK